MEQLKDAIKKLKDELYNFQITTKGSDLDRIMNMKDLTEEAKRELLLLFTNLKEEMYDLKHYQLVTLSKAADCIVEIVDTLAKSIDTSKERITTLEDRVLKVEEKQNKSFLSIIMSSTLYKTIAGIMAFIIFLVILHGINPASTTWASETVKGFFGGATNSESVLKE